MNISASDWIQIGIGALTFISVLFIWLSTKANNERSKKELTIQYTNAHDADVEELLLLIHNNSLNGKLNLEKVHDDENLLWKVEKYLFAMERLAVGINTNVFDIYVFDRIMGQKTIEHYEALCDYIKYIRKNDYNEKYTEFEKLIKQLRLIRDKRFPKSEKLTKGNISKLWG